MHEDGDENDLEDWEVEEALVTDNKRRGERDRPEVGTCGPPAAGTQPSPPTAAHLQVSRLVEDKSFLHHSRTASGKEVTSSGPHSLHLRLSPPRRPAQVPIKYHLCPRNDWRAFPKRLGSNCARNELGWTGGLPLPLPPNPSCWLVPVEDCAALGIARHRDALIAVGWRVLTSPEDTVAAAPPASPSTPH